MAGLPEELKKKLSEGSALTPDEVKQVAAHNAELERDAQYRRDEATQAFKDRDEAKKRARELEDAEQKRKQAEETDVDRLKREKADAEDKLKAAEAEAEEGRQYRKAKIEDAKKALGEAWDESYAKLSIVALDKLVVKLTDKKPGTPPPAGGSGEAPQKYEDYLNNPSRYMKWAAENPAEKDRLRIAYETGRRG